MRVNRQIVIFLAAMGLSLFSDVALADRLRSLTGEGNRLVADEKYDEALEKYRSAQVEAPESSYLYFNIANALQRQSKYDEAIAEYRKVYSPGQPSLAAWALYNIGVCQYRQAEQAIGTQDYQKALQLLEQCMESNREAMRIIPNDEDPKFNYEQAKRKWKEVLDALKKQQEERQKQQEQQKQDQQKQDQQKQEEKEQQEQQQQQQKKEDQGTSQPQQGEEKPTSSTEQAQQQPRIGEMSPEDAERILNSLPEQNADDLRRLLAPRSRGDFQAGKDW